MQFSTFGYFTEFSFTLPYFMHFRTFHRAGIKSGICLPRLWFWCHHKLNIKKNWISLRNSDEKMPKCGTGILSRYTRLGTLETKERGKVKRIIHTFEFVNLAQIPKACFGY